MAINWGKSRRYTDQDYFLTIFWGFYHNNDHALICTCYHFHLRRPLKHWTIYKYKILSSLKVERIIPNEKKTPLQKSEYTIHKYKILNSLKVERITPKEWKPLQKSEYFSKQLLFRNVFHFFLVCFHSFRNEFTLYNKRIQSEVINRLLWLHSFHIYIQTFTFLKTFEKCHMLLHFECLILHITMWLAN